MVDVASPSDEQPAHSRARRHRCSYGATTAPSGTVSRRASFGPTSRLGFTAPSHEHTAATTAANRPYMDEIILRSTPSEIAARSPSKTAAPALKTDAPALEVAAAAALAADADVPAARRDRFSLDVSSFVSLHPEHSRTARPEANRRLEARVSRFYSDAATASRLKTFVSAARSGPPASRPAPT